MEYKVVLEKMEFRAYHGCYELERKVGNRFVVDVTITTELGEIASRDGVTLSVNYLTVYEMVRGQMAITSHTIEAVASRIIESIKGRFPEVKQVWCRVSKVAPPLGGKVAKASVELYG